MNTMPKLEDVFNFNLCDGADGSASTKRLMCNIDMLDRVDIDRFVSQGGYPTDTLVYRPPVFIVNGYGSSGKDTLVSLVRYAMTSLNYPASVANISPIYPAIARAIAELEPDMPVMLKYTSIMDDMAPGEVFEKTPAWRTLAHEIKNAWHKVNDGPNVWILSKVISAVTSDNAPMVIFIHIREAVNIERVRAALIKMGFPVCTLLLKGRVESSDQPEDKTVFDYQYDRVIDNSGPIEVLRREAKILSMAVIMSQRDPQNETIREAR